MTKRAMSLGVGTAMVVAAVWAGGSAAVAAGQQAAAKTPQFEEASIRPCDPDNIPAPPAGSRGGGANSFQMTPGRTHAVCMTIATILRHAYGYGPADLEFLTGGRSGGGRGLGMNNVYGLGVEDGVRVRGGPDWVRNDHYTIDAVADGAADAASMSGPMMRALLESRFKLKAHVETEQVPAFAITIASGGLRIKPAGSGACDPIVPVTLPGGGTLMRPRSFTDVRRGEKPSCGISAQANGPNQVIVGGEATLAAIARSMGGPLGNVQVFDRTGNTDKFNFMLEFVWDENTPGRRIMLPWEQPGEPADAPRAATIFTALEQQIGLRLEPAKAPRDYIQIDNIERPSAN
jgi:uncharacterized protein (TIGR03435 family)